MTKLRVDAPVSRGAGERWFDDINLPDLGSTCTQHVASQRAARIVLTRA